MSTVQLHVVQELWEMLSIDSDTESHTDQSDSEVQLHMILSKEALLAGNSPRALKYLGDISRSCCDDTSGFREFSFVHQ
jgi:hypothetical protein